MTIAIGTDIIDIQRIADAIERQGDKFVQRILTQSEISEYQARGHSVSFLAKRFAAKEAIAKALGTGIGRGISFQHMIISNNAEGAPQVELQDNAAERLNQLDGTNVLLSLSDEKNYAIAYVAIV
ncbi:MAG: holo-ACP synthase [Porticoccaceae bacterium]|jgi:holo-[acyl-carrier protein] synthase|nr:holo-ACP synthase [Porticoccaceae bacterium]RPG83941.1 MAG: holo-ACP synthase [Cellvibrionales bacterium TMED47]|tara:strand:- start:9029 stop:9403 length:375 start_codon:yes stop_codon:yes gene_type:complete